MRPTHRPALSSTPRSLAALVVSAVLLVASVAPARAQADTGEEGAAAIAVAEAALAAITHEDMVAFTDLMVEGTDIWSIRQVEGRWVSRVRSREVDRSSVPTVDIVERGFEPEVQVSGPMAVVWFPYDLYVDGGWSHCGVDVFTMFRGDEGWRIVSLAYTVEQPPACREHPDGPPGGEGR